jgi:hypothetical protein
LLSELAYIRGSIEIAERDIAYISDWIREHPADAHVPDYRRILAIDEASLRRARKRNDALERRLARLEAPPAPSGATSRAFLSRLRFGRRTGAVPATRSRGSR